MSWKTDIQANILRGLPARSARYLFLKFGSQEELQSFIRTLLPRVPSAAWQRDHFGPRSEMDDAVLNLAFTRQGLDLALGTPEGQTQYISDERRRFGLQGTIPLNEADAFAPRTEIPNSGQDGEINLDPDAENSMYRRLDLLGEAPISGRSHSWRWDPLQAIHVLAWISGPDKSKVDELSKTVLAAGGVFATDITGDNLDISAQRHPDDLGPFGFKDGINQPAIEGFHGRHEVFGRGALSPTGWRGLAPGEFIVGEKDEGGERRRPLPGDVLHNSTFLAFRQIRMWPDRFENLLEENGSRLGVSADTVGGWFVGRHRYREDNDGVSLMIDGPEEDRDFLYGGDPEGLRCPIGAHIRRANPRDELGKEGLRSNRHRIIRRGMPYKILGTSGETEVVLEQGLAFIALQARIEDQFEFIQAHWLNVGPTLHTGQDPDPIAGNLSADVKAPRFVKQGEATSVIALPRSGQGSPLTDVLGGEYFVMPSLTGLSKMLE